MLLQDLIDLFIADVCAGKSNETPSAYRQKLRVLSHWLGNIPADEISSDTLKQFKNHLLTRNQKQRGSSKVQGKLSVWTIRSVLRTVKHLFRWAYDNEYLQSDLAHNLKVPKAPPIEPKYISQITFEELLAAVPKVGNEDEQARNKAILFFLRDTGARTGALLNAKMDGLNLASGELETSSKGKIGYVYFSEPTIAALSDWIRRRAALQLKTDHLFVTCHPMFHRTGTELKRPGLRSILYRLAQAGNVHGRYNAHSFRHAFARDALKSRKTNLAQVSQLMWHSGINVTADYYARWDNTELHEVHQVVSPINLLNQVQTMEV